MREYEPIYIRPLTLRGVFGITWRVFSRRLGATALYQLLYFLVALLLMAPTASSFISAITALGDVANPTPQLMLTFTSGLLGGIFLFALAWLVLVLLIIPIYNGTLYGEMSARIYGCASSVGLMVKRSKYSLKRFFSTMMCYTLCTLAITFVINLVVSISSGFLTVFSVMGALPSLMEGTFTLSAGFVIPLVVLMIIAPLATSAAYSFIAFVFPVAVNEPAKNFTAIKRSFSLVGKRFMRVFGCTLILVGATFAVMLLSFLFMMLGLLVATGPIPSAALMAIGAAIYFVAVLLLAPYQAALYTVLYFDARTRQEGTAWLGEAQAPASAAEAPAPLFEEDAAAPSAEADAQPYEPYWQESAPTEHSPVERPQEEAHEEQDPWNNF